MTKKNKWVLITAICIVLVIASVGVFYLLNRNNNDVVVPDYTFSTESYKYYSDDKLDFDFVVASVKIVQKDDLNESLLLSSLAYGEYTLDQSADYIQKIIDLGGKTTDLKLHLTSIVFTDHQAVVNLFIPFTKDKQVASIDLVYKSDSESTLTFLINDAHIGDSTILGLETTTPTDPTDPEEPEEPGDPTGTIIGSGLIEIYNVSDFKYVGEDGTETPSPLSSKSSVFAMPVSFSVPTGESWTIDSVVLSVGSTEYTALGKQYQLEGYSNVIDSTITQSTRGYFFFETIQYTVVENSDKLKMSITLSNGDVYQFTVVLA